MIASSLRRTSCSVLNPGWVSKTMDGFGRGAGQTQVTAAFTQEQQAGVGGQITASEIYGDFAAGR